MHWGTLSGAAILATFAWAGSGQAEDWLVKSEHAECLAKNIDAYVDAQSDPVVIFLEACPIADMQQAMASLQQNMTQPKIKQVDDGSGPAIDDIVVFSKADLACLKRVFPIVSGKAMRLPKNPDCGDG